MSLLRLVCAASAVAAAARETCTAGDCPASSPAAGVSLIALRSPVTKRGLHMNSLLGEDAFVSVKGLEKETGLLNQVIALPGGDDVRPPRSFVEELADMRANPHLTVLLNATDSSIGGLLGNVTGAANNDTVLRDRMFAAFGDIATDFGKKKATVQGLKDAAASAKTLHADCRAAESSAFVDKESCTVQKDLLSNQAKNALMVVQAQQGAHSVICESNAAGQGENFDDAYEPMKELINASTNFVKVTADHKAKVGVCGGLTTTHGAKVVECDKKQRAFEAAVCQHFTTSETECELYEALYTRTVADYNVVCDNIATREAERIIDFKHLKRVHCVVKALVISVNDKAGTAKDTLVRTIEGCYAKKFDVSGLTMQPKPAPSPATCSPSPTVVPCSSSFATTEYGALPKGVAAATCESSCEVTTTTTTITATTTTTTAPTMEWQLAININPSDGHKMGYGAKAWFGDDDVGSQSTALTKDYVSKAAYGKTSNYVAIARHPIGSATCEAAKVWKWTDQGLTFHSHFNGKSNGNDAPQTTGGSIYNDELDSLAHKDQDPIFGNTGDLQINYWYSNNGCRLFLTSAYGYPTTGNTDDIHGFGNEFGASTSSFKDSASWYHDIAQRYHKDCHGGSCPVMGTDHGSSLKSGSISYQYAIYTSETDDTFPCTQRTLKVLYHGQ